MIKNLRIKLFNISTGGTSNESLVVGFVRQIMSEHADFFEEFLVKEAIRGKRTARIQMYFSKHDPSGLNTYGFGTLLVKIPMMGEPDLRPHALSTLKEILVDDYNLVIEDTDDLLSLTIRW
jgi:hypothetical protein